MMCFLAFWKSLAAPSAKALAHTSLDSESPLNPRFSQNLTQSPAPFCVRHPGEIGTQRIGNIRRGKHSTERDDGDGKEPQVPGDDKSRELIETELGPLINTAFERHPIAQVNDDGSLRNVKKQDGEQPKEKVRLAELGRCADPSRADNEENLSQDEVAQTDPRAKKVKPQDLVDTRYLDEMEKSGFFDQLWARNK